MAQPWATDGTPLAFAGAGVRNGHNQVPFKRRTSPKGWTRRLLFHATRIHLPATEPHEKRRGFGNGTTRKASTLNLPFARLYAASHNRYHRQLNASTRAKYKSTFAEDGNPEAIGIGLLSRRTNLSECE